MIYLLDTNAFSDLFRDNPRLQGHVARLAPVDQIVICPIVRGEILHGIRRLPAGQRRQDLESRAAILFASVSCWDMSEAGWGQLCGDQDQRPADGTAA